MKAASLYGRHRRPLAPGLLFTLRDAFRFADRKHQTFLDPPGAQSPC